MTVYVHKMEGQGRAFLGGFRGAMRARLNAPTDPWFVLTADTDRELHAFAKSLGLTRVMFRPGKQALPKQRPEAPRYPITMGERDRAIKLGARLISAREANEMLQQRASRMDLHRATPSGRVDRSTSTPPRRRAVPIPAKLPDKPSPCIGLSGCVTRALVGGAA